MKNMMKKIKDMTMNLRYNNLTSPKQGRLGRVLSSLNREAGRVFTILCLMMASVGA